MSNRLFNTAEELQSKEAVRNMLSIYSKVEKQSQQIARRASKKNQPIPVQKQISSQQVLRMLKKPKKPPTPSLNKSKDIMNKQQHQKRSQLKNRIGNLKAQINTEQKSLNNTKKVLTTTSKQETEYMLFRLKLLSKRVSNTEVSMERFMMKDAFNKIKVDWQSVRQLQAKFVLKRYKKLLRKYFDEFYKQTIILKLQREKFEQKKWLQRQQRNEKVAQDYKQFIFYKKAMELWKLHHQKIKVEKQKQKYIVTQKAEEKNDLRNKLDNFLSKMKEDINPPLPSQQIQQAGYNTIKQELEESLESNIHDWGSQQNQFLEIENLNQNNPIQQAPNSQQPFKKMTNDDLLKKRQQLQLKNKQRKETLQKLKKEKQELRLKAEQQKRLEQEKLRELQKKKRKEDHQKFVQKKKQEQQKRRKQQFQRKRMDDLYVQAQQHDRRRIMKFKGLIPWKRLIKERNQKLVKVVRAIQKVDLSTAWRCFIEGYESLNQTLQQKQQIEVRKAEQYYNKKMKMKVICLIRLYNQTAGKQEKRFLEQFREQHILRQAFSNWRKVMAELKEQNYQQQTKQNKIIDLFRYKFLTKAGFNAFYRNKEQEQRQRRILEHKTKLKQKMEQLMGPKPQLDINKLL